MKKHQPHPHPHPQRLATPAAETVTPPRAAAPAVLGRTGLLVPDGRMWRCLEVELLEGGTWRELRLGPASLRNFAEAQLADLLHAIALERAKPRRASA